MGIDVSRDRYALVGNPVAHSRSPQIHAAFARQTGQPIDYALMLAPIDPPGAFEAQVRAFFAAGGKGMNVTVPFKQRALALASELSPRARAARALNTLALDGARLIGENTDGAGLLADLLDNLGGHADGLRDARVLLIGAGGAARGVVLPLLEAGVSQITIANRTLARAQVIAADLAPLIPPRAAAPSARPASGSGSMRLRAIGLVELNQGAVDADIVINATSAGLKAGGAALVLSPTVFSCCRLACDMVYGAEPTAFLRAAQEAGAVRVVDGLGMLVGQAADSFALWRGVRPDTAPVLAALRETLRRADS